MQANPLTEATQGGNETFTKRIVGHKQQSSRKFALLFYDVKIVISWNLQYFCEKLVSNTGKGWRFYQLKQFFQAEVL